jgi:hypothetical protein
MEEMNQSQAVNVLIQAARIAQGKGAFSLEDAELVSRAIKVFTPKGESVMNEEAIEAESPTEAEA